jgi:hypothetical protein
MDRATKSQQKVFSHRNKNENMFLVYKYNIQLYNAILGILPQ